MERFKEFGSYDGHADEGFRFLGGFFTLSDVDPAALLANIDHLKHVRIQPHLLKDPTKRGLMHPRRTCGNNDLCEVVVLDVSFDQDLSGIRTEISIVFRN